MSRFHYCLLKCEAGRRLLKRAQSLMQTWCTYTKKKVIFQNCLKISMRSSAFHRRSTFPLPHKSSHPRGNFPNTRSSFLFFVVFSVMTNGSRIQIISWAWQVQRKEEPWGVRTKSFPLSTLSRGFLLGLPSLPSSCGKPWEPVPGVRLGSQEGTLRIHVPLGQGRPPPGSLRLYPYTCPHLPLHAPVECTRLGSSPQSSLHRPAVPR